MNERAGGFLPSRDLSQTRYNAKLRELGLSEGQRSEAETIARQLLTEKDTAHALAVGAIILLGPRAESEVGRSVVEKLSLTPPLEREVVLVELEREARLNNRDPQQT